MIKQKGSFRHKVKTAVKSVDTYGVPVTFSYKNRDKFRTLPGGILTIISRLIILLFFFVQIPEVVNKNKTVSYKAVRVNFNNDNDPYIFNSDNFDIAVRVFNPYGQLSDEMKYNRSRYFKFEFASLTQYPIVQGNKTIVISNNTVQDFGPCTTDRLGNLTDQTASLLLTNIEWVCPREINLKLLGSPFTQTRTTFKFRVVPCNQAKQAGITDDNITCASDEDIEKAINSHFIHIVTLVQYFDENEFDSSPVKKEVKSLMQNIAPNVAFFKSNLYQRVNVTTKDSWFGSSFKNRDYSYYETADLANALTGSIKPGIHDLITFTYSKYNKEYVIVRRVTSLMDILSTTGGFSSVVMFVSLLISKLFQQQLFEKSLIKKIFKEQSNNLCNLQSSESNSDLASAIITDLNQRKPPQITYSQQFNQMMKSLLMCRRNSNQMIKSKLDFYTQLLHQKMDVVDLVKNVSQLKIIQQMLLTQKQKALLPYLDMNILKPNEYSYYNRMQSLGKTLNEYYLHHCVKKLVKNRHNNNKDKIFLSNLANIPINQGIFKKRVKSSESNPPNFGFAFEQENQNPNNSIKSQKPKRQKLSSSRKLRQIFSMNDTNRFLMKGHFEGFNY